MNRKEYEAFLRTAKRIKDVSQSRSFFDDDVDNDDGDDSMMIAIIFARCRFGSSVLQVPFGLLPWFFSLGKRL